MDLLRLSGGLLSLLELPDRSSGKHSRTCLQGLLPFAMAAPEEPEDAKTLPETGTAVASVNRSKEAIPEEPRSANTPGKPE